MILFASVAVVSGNNFAQAQMAPIKVDHGAYLYSTVEGVHTVWLFAPVKGNTLKSKEMTDRAMRLLEKLIPALGWTLTEDEIRQHVATLATA